MINLEVESRDEKQLRLLAKRMLELKVIFNAQIYPIENLTLNEKGFIVSSSRYLLKTKTKARFYSKLERFILEEWQGDQPLISAVPLSNFNSDLITFLENDFNVEKLS